MTDLNKLMETKVDTGFIAGISRGHNAGVCLLYHGKVVFAIEEERLSRRKYDGSPFAAMDLIRKYTDKIDWLVISGSTPLLDNQTVEYTGDSVYTGLARKLGLIDNKFPSSKQYNHPQVLDVYHLHHKTHAASAFYRSGFKDAVSVVVDGSGTAFQLTISNELYWAWETESIIDCSYPCGFKTLYKHYGVKEPILSGLTTLDSTNLGGEEGLTHEAYVTNHSGITKVYEATTEYCGFNGIEAGKTMGLFPYGKKNNQIPKLFIENTDLPISNRNLTVPNYPQDSIINQNMYSYLRTTQKDVDLTTLDNRRDLAYACQIETQEQVLKLIRKAVKMSGKKNVVLSGGYGLNCVANYYYLNELKKEGINLYVEPISNDGGTAIGAAFMHYYNISGSTEPQPKDIYLGPQYNYPAEYIDDLCEANLATVTQTTKRDVVELLRKKNLVTIFQGRSENGPRALGNRSILFDPTFKDGKDFVNGVKHREYFRPFAGSILKEHAHEWFDLRGMEDSPHMMYAVNCQPGVAEKIPSIIHVDNTCRIQTVSKEENLHYYELIEEFYKQTGVPIIFNTSFNLGGDPLVETLEDALFTLKNSDIEYLYLPEYDKLIYVKNQKDTTSIPEAE